MHPVDASLPKLACQAFASKQGDKRASVFLIIDADFLSYFQIIGIAAKRAGLAVHSALRQRSDVPIEVLQMRLEHAKKKIDIVGRLRNFEKRARNIAYSRRDSQRQFLCDQINCAQPHCELLQKAAEHE